jgi:predicted amino acid-binding ACT domain protein
MIDFDMIKTFSTDNPIGVVIEDVRNVYLGIVSVDGINYNLTDVSDRESLESGFQTLLNGLDYKIKIVVQSRKIEIDNFAVQYTENLKRIEKSIMHEQSKLNMLISKKDNTKKIEEVKDKLDKLRSQYEYGIKLNNYILSKCENENILDKKYYICFPYYHNASQYKENLTDEEILVNAFYDLSNKAESIIGSLHRCGLNSKVLTGHEIGELYYRPYNRGASEVYKYKKAIANNFSHLYTSSEAVEVKALKRRVDELQKLEDGLNEKKGEIKEGGLILD